MGFLGSRTPVEELQREPYTGSLLPRGTMNNIFYVYVHEDPVTNEVVYVGKGCYGRAWDVTRNRNGHVEHLIWMKSKSDAGFLPSDWVRILVSGLTEQEAFNKEKEFLYSIGGTKFNRQSGERNYQAKLTNAQAREVFIRANKESHKTLAEEYGVSRSAISMIANKKQWKAATYNMGASL